ncbi:phospholipase A2 [Patulibacter minatonensis]|uniref:phospholipase A2 n=1 Tax=Patulibacter minatonensis TaxID=298163 RepID=UPI0006840717|nr:phospholipase A2 [Patulibacter minatonensis]
MTALSARLRNRSALVALVVALVALAATLSAATPAHAFTKEQLRYGKESIGYTADQFAARKADFVAHGCWTGPAGCNKPSPYNEFDWSDDGCSPPTPDHLRERFRNACLQHDFGYRNFGNGLMLERTENRRYRIDVKFRNEMNRICGRMFSGNAKRVCKAEATVMYKAVRRFNNWQQQ